MKALLLIWCAVVLLAAQAAGAAPVSPAASATIDPKAMALLKRAEAKMQSARSLVCNVYYIGSAPIGSSPGSTRTLSVLQFKRPNLAHVEVFDETKSNSGVWSKRSTPDWLFVSDGSKGWQYYPFEKQCSVSRMEPSGENVNTGASDFLGSFFDTRASLAGLMSDLEGMGNLEKLNILGARRWDGRQYQVIEASGWLGNHNDPSETSAHFIREIYIGSDGLIYRIALHSSIDGSDVEEDEYTTKVKLNVPFAKSIFVFHAPAGTQITVDSN